MNTLLIAASGKSTRFGGEPKAFAPVLGEVNVARTIRLARGYFSDIRVIVSEDTKKMAQEALPGVPLIPIVTGQGDADSLRKALRKMETAGELPDRLALCWGDAVFLSQRPFEQLGQSAEDWDESVPALVACAEDEHPYAWFEVEGVEIRRARFRKEEMQPVAWGLHDQSLFALSTAPTLIALDECRHEMGLDKYDENSYDRGRGEMRLLDVLAHLFLKGRAAEAVKISARQVLGVNTKEELREIEKILATTNEVKK